MVNLLHNIKTSLAWRLAVPITIVVTFAVALHITLLSSQRDLYNQKLTESQRVGWIIETVLMHDMQNNLIHDFQAYLNMLAGSEDISAIRVYNNEGVLKYALRDSAIGEQVNRENNPRCSACHLYYQPKPVKIMNIQHTPKGDYIFQADFPLKNSDRCRKCHSSSQINLGNLLTELSFSSTELRILNHRRNMVIAGAAVMIVAIVLMILAVQYQIVKPLKNMVNVIEESKQGKALRRIEVKRSDEIGYLARTYNEMMDNMTAFQNSLEEQVEARTKELESSRVQLLFRENLASLGRLAAGIAHELGNPLTGISSIVQLVKRRKKDDAFVVEQLNLVHQEIDRLARLSRQLVDLARPENPSPSIFNLQTCIEKAYHIASLDRRLKKRTIILKLGDQSYLVEANEDAVIQIVMNLLFNAADATEDKGVIVLSISSNNNFVEIEIKDDGIGIPEDSQRKIFDPFFSTKGIGKGAGLGLSVSHSLARSFNGDLYLKYSSPQGSAFILTIPRPKEHENVR